MKKHMHKFDDETYLFNNFADKRLFLQQIQCSFQEYPLPFLH